MATERARIDSWQWQHNGVASELLSFLSDYDFQHCPEHEALEVFNHNPRKGVVWASLTWSGERYFVKARTSLTMSRRLSMAFKPSASRIEWDRMGWLQQQGLLTTQRAALGELRKCRLLFRDVLLVHWEEQALPLEKYHERLMATAVDAAEQQQQQAKLMRTVGRTLAEMHQRLCFHRQFHFGNVMYRGDDPETADALIIDLKHLTILSHWSDTEWLWSFYILPYWLRAPVIDWSEGSSDLQNLLEGYFSVCPSGFSSCQEMYDYLRAIIPSSSPDKLHKRPKKISSSWLQEELGVQLERSFQSP